MEIINNYDKKRDLIKNVSIGECFMYKDRLCMKVKSSVQEEYYNNKFVDFKRRIRHMVKNPTSVLIGEAWEFPLDMEDCIELVKEYFNDNLAGAIEYFYALKINELSSEIDSLNDEIEDLEREVDMLRDQQDDEAESWDY